MSDHKVRVFYRRGPGDSYKTVQREIPARGQHYPGAAREAVEVAYAAHDHRDGEYLAQDLDTGECRPFRCLTKPTITEM